MGKHKKSTDAPVFRLKPNNRSNSADIKYVGTCLEGEKLGDEPLDIPSESLGSISGYEITATIYKCNIMGTYLLQNRKLPLYNVHIMFHKSIISGVLMNIYVYFTINEQDKLRLKTPASYVNAHVNGTYTIELVGDDGLTNRLKSDVPNIIEKIVVAETMIENKDMTNEKMRELVETLDVKIKERNELAMRFIKGLTLPIFPNEKIVTETHLRGLYRSNYIHPIIQIALEVRNEIRLKEMNVSMDPYTIPTKVINLKQIQDNTNFVNEYMDQI